MVKKLVADRFQLKCATNETMADFSEAMGQAVLDPR
jgi:hypothetical protein